MRGYLCERKAGWDTHGLPVEVEVCKELGIHSKEEIEAFGVEPFIRKCVESVFRYTQQWEQLTERLGFWIHLGRGLRHLPPELRGERLVGAEDPVRPRPALPGAQDRLVVGPRRHGPQLRRSRPRLPRGGRPERLRAVSAGRRGEQGEERSRGSGEGEALRFRPNVPSPSGRGQGEGLLPTPICWSGPPRPGRCRATIRRRQARLEYSVVAVEGETRKLILASALVEAVAGQGRQEVHRRSDVAGRAADRPALPAAVPITTTTPRARSRAA